MAGEAGSSAPDREHAALGPAHLLGDRYHRPQETVSGWAGTPIRYISINVPPEILGTWWPGYAAVRSGLRAHVGQILLEITERGVPDQLGLKALNMMAEQGVGLALDDVASHGCQSRRAVARGTLSK